TIKALLKDVDVDALDSAGITAVLKQVTDLVATVKSFGQAVSLLPFENLKTLSFDATSALIGLAGGVETLAGNLNGYFKNFYSESEQLAQANTNVSATLADIGLSLPNLAAGSDAARAQFRAYVDAQDLSTEKGRTAYVTLLGLADAFSQLTSATDAATKSAADAAKAKADEAAKAAADAAAAEKLRVKNATDSIFRSLQTAVGVDRTALQARVSVASEAVTSAQAARDASRQASREIYGETASTSGLQASDGNAFIRQALAAARGTGYLPEAGRLTEAIGAARGGLTADNYGSQFDLDRARLILAGQLSQLEDASGDQLTAAEQQLKAAQDQVTALDKTLDYWKLQIDAANGNVDATLSVADAVAQLTALLSPKSAPPAAGAAAGGATFGGGGTSTGSVPASKYGRQVSYGTAGWFTEGVTDAGQVAGLDKLAALNAGFSGTGDVAGLLNATKAAGFSLSDLQAVTGYTYADWLQAAQSVGIPRFDVGTNIVPRDMLAQIHEGEAIVPRAYNPALAGGQGASSEIMGEVLAELRTLRARLDAIEANTQATAIHTNGTKRALNRAMPDSDALAVRETT
ncbi:MAG: Prophage tail length tape measure, partial [Rhodoferax sp.]|nr:Prophage tail length tape measure [Rhodoferax sp.]